MKTIIIALGGNALIRKGQSGTISEQFNNLQVPVSQIVKLAGKYRLVITHGNGPQVGNLLLQQHSCKQVPEMPLEVLVAMTQGQVGYMIEETLDNEFMKLNINRPLLSTLITYAQVDPKDPAFKNPTKPIGPAFKIPKPGFKKTSKGWRKVVPSPKPVKIVGAYKIRELLNSGFVVVTCGGGGIPAVKKSGRYVGIEAVIDKDLASAQLGNQINADILLMVTDVEGAAINFGRENQEFLEEVSLSDLKKFQKVGHFAEGSMGPKVQAAINFLENGGERAVITGLDKIPDALDGNAGTQIT